MVDSQTQIRNGQFRIKCIKEYLEKHYKKYEKVYNYTWENWEKLGKKAQNTNNYKIRCIPISVQLEDLFNIPTYISEDITSSISILKSIS